MYVHYPQSKLIHNDIMKMMKIKMNMNNHKITNSKITPATNKSSFSLQEFYEWLCGLTDGEGNFYFGRKGSTNTFQFFFQIQLHIDDFHALLHIRDTLGLGRVLEFKNTCIFRVDNFEGGGFAASQHKSGINSKRTDYILPAHIELLLIDY